MFRALCSRKTFWSLFILLAGLRLWMACSLNLAEDEAYYWVWSRHLAMSYFDHPPMVAWLIRASTWMLGDSEGAVRLPGVVLSLASVPVVMWGLRARSLPLARVAGLVLLCSPGPALAGSIITPDAPVWFFGCAAMAFAARALSVERPRALWLGFGACLGLAMVSKYTAGILGPCIFLALLSHPRGRLHLVLPWFWMGAAIAAFGFAPVVIWNAQHGWASFKFQFGHAFDGRGAVWWKSVGDLLGGMILAWTPLLFILTVAGVNRARREVSTGDVLQRVWLACLVLPLALFLYSATKRRVEINWPLLLCIPAAALAARQVVLGPAWSRVVGAWGVVLALLMTMVLQLPPVIDLASGRIRHLAQLRGYQELAAEADRLAAGGAVFANRYQDASQLTYYRKGRVSVWPLNFGDRDNAFSYFEGGLRLGDTPRAVLVNVPEQHVPNGWRVLERKDWQTEVGGRKVRTDSVLVVQREPR